MAACGHVKDDGSTCGTAFGLCDGCGRCWSHCDHRAEERAAAKSKGGQATARKHAAKRHGDGTRTVNPDALPFDGPPATIDEVHAWLGWVSYAALVGVVDKDTAGKVAYALDKCRIAMERGEKMDARLKALERSMKARDG